MTNESTDPPVEPAGDPLLDALLDPPPSAAAAPAPRRAFFALSPNTTSPTETIQPLAPPPLAVTHDETAYDGAADPEAELPLLTDIVVDSAIDHAGARTDAEALRRELANWLAEELPATVLQVTDGIADQLVKELTDRAEQQLLPRLLMRLGKTD